MTKGFLICPECSTPVQRLMDPNTTPCDGLVKHYQMVHPGKVVEPCE